MGTFTDTDVLMDTEYDVDGSDLLSAHLRTLWALRIWPVRRVKAAIYVVQGKMEPFLCYRTAKDLGLIKINMQAIDENSCTAPHQRASDGISRQSFLTSSRWRQQRQSYIFRYRGICNLHYCHGCTACNHNARNFRCHSRGKNKATPRKIHTFWETKSCRLW